LKVLAGNPGKRKLNEAEPQLEDATLDPPKELLYKKNSDALEEWTRLAPVLYGGKILKEVDRTALFAYCLTFQKWLHAERKIRTKGIFQTTPNGYQQISPWVTVSGRCLKQMTALMAEFGMTPSSRSRLSVSGNGDINLSNPFAQYLYDAKKRS